VEFHFTYLKLRKQPFLLKFLQENVKLQNLPLSPPSNPMPVATAVVEGFIFRFRVLGRAAEPERRTWAFCLEREPELKLKIRSRSSA